MALVDEIFDERVLGRKIQDVMFHDPGGHDKNGFRIDLLGNRRILNEFD